MVSELFKLYRVVAVSVGIVNPLSSSLPSRMVTPFAAALATGFASYNMRQYVVSRICSILHASGFSGLQRLVLSLLDLMNLTATFGRLKLRA
jgi:uncharacterized membrane protein required for colicin V production